MNKLQKISCPICGKQNTWHSENNFRPFCSERCKLIDLGEWANETRKIPGDPVDPNSSPVGNDTPDESGEQFF
ncbi:DNA gyrase inhibitor YacG [Legionella bononiensis]|uniref:DNA gyrase inhibitor YacG n=1 Tax=Legionella bononiensis TaxID=2793102 RepID=A0ABS1WC23_9GAMM|nr:DNA gyrase inhibitor YacG [Legionella bononiensis]MBL7479170.1 DNA gyrase inhibitor YacG [Legionella bononiensis]MBL7526906.1 DNA gyrase inhibitor YacG [Legionella bononiensis]MBL7563820.1 DNA gyrase inhibitor YacG [Legionella bononiensis]